MKTIALILFILMYALMIAVPKYRPYYALAAAAIFLITGILPPDRLATAINWNVLMMMAGTMVIVYYFIDSRMPVLLADNGKSVSQAVLDALKTCGIRRVIIVGGEAAVSPAAADQLTRAGLKIRARLWGKNGVATSAAIAAYGIDVLGLSPNNMGVATSQNYPDALAGAAFCGFKRSVLILADDKATQNTSFPADYAGTIKKGFVFGGETAVGKKTLNLLQASTE